MWLKVKWVWRWQKGDHMEFDKIVQKVYAKGTRDSQAPGPMLLNFGDRTRTGAFNMVWPLTYDQLT
jgi:hypothetical protein